MMTILTRASNNQPVTLSNQIASSGEGEVWETNISGILAKIYHNPTLERIEKLKVMLANPPADPMLSSNHISIAWPQDLLKDGSGNCLGFLMPAIRLSKELPSVYHPKLRRRNAPGFNWYYLHVTALNVAWIIQAIHEKGYVLGDIKPQNILVNDRALVAAIDTDSFQVRDNTTGKVYRCTVGSEGFTPVELLGKDFSVTEQTEIHDRFRLAVLIHYLLFGYHPFSGEWIGTGESPDQTELIRKGFWYSGQNSLIRASQNTIPLDIIHSELKQCFLRCFNDGHTSPNLRPTAEDWHNALEIAVNELAVCSTLDSHHYSKSYGKCYWCERKVKLGVDIFPFVAGASSIPTKATTKQSTVIQIPSSTSTNQASKPLNLQPLSNSASTTVQSVQLPPNTNTGLSDWQKAVLTGSVIGTFLLVGLLLTRQQPLPVPSLAQQSVAQQDISSAPSDSSTDTSISQQFEQPQTRSTSELSLKPSVPSMLGTWYGDFGLNNPSSILIITHQFEETFEGNLTTTGRKGGKFIIGIEGEINQKTRRVTMREVRIIEKPMSESWFLGINLGVLSSDLHRIQGTGEDPRGNKYSWTFYKK